MSSLPHSLPVLALPLILSAVGGLRAPATAVSNRASSTLASRAPHASAAGSHPTHPADLFDPCLGLGTPSLYADSETHLVIGCTGGLGLWHSSDAGESFTVAHPSNDFDVFDVARTRAGAMLVCGHDYGDGDSNNDDVLLYSGQPGGRWRALMSASGNVAAAPNMASVSSCGAVAEAGDGQLLISSLAAPFFTWSEDGGATWSTEVHHPLHSEGADSPVLFRLQGVDHGIYGAGGQRTEPPMFFPPRDGAEASWWSLQSVAVDRAIEGEVWALATPDGGDTWITGGRDRSSSSPPSAFLHRSIDGGTTWTALSLPTTASIVRDVAFDGDGEHGVAVGHRHPTSLGGFALITDDGGASWIELDEDVPLLETTTVFGDTYWLSGDAFLRRRSFHGHLPRE